MKRILVGLCVGIRIFAGVQGLAQIQVDNSLPITTDQTAVLPILQKVRTVILENDKAGLVDMLVSTAMRDSDPLPQRIMDSRHILSCVIFDTSCARASLKAEGERRIRLKDARRGEVLVSVD